MSSLRTMSWLLTASLPWLLSALPTPVGAQDTAPLAPILITASRTPETTRDSLAAVSVIERSEIERRQSRNLPDVLQGLPGVTLRSNGGLGHNTNLYLRGTNPDHTLLLVNGIKLGSASSGFLPWQSLPIAQIDRVEVVRGPRSSLYGSEAIGGVIQLFTRRSTPGPIRPRLTTTFGSEGRAEGQLGLSGEIPGSGGKAWLDGAIGLQRSDGFDVCADSAGCGVDEPDRDGYRNNNATLSAGWEASEQLEFDVNFLRSDGRLDYDGSSRFGNHRRSKIQLLSASAVAQPTSAWTTTLRTGRSRDDARIFSDGERINRLDTRRDQFNWQNDVALDPDQTVSLGIDWLRDRLDATREFAEDQRDNTGVFAQYRGGIADHALQLSLRHDDNEQFGGETTGNIAWGYELGNGLRATASYGTAFKAPTFNDLYFPGFGDPTLDPESSSSIEFGLAGDHTRGEWTINLFHTEIDDLISFDPTTFSPKNIEQARIRGLEFSTRTQIANWRLAANLTLLDPRNRSAGPNKDNLLQRRPEQTLRLDVDRDFGRFAVGGTLFASGRRFDDDANQVRVGGFTLIDLRTEYALSKALRIQGRVENLFDKDYETAAHFNQPGRSFFVTLVVQP